MYGEQSTMHTAVTQHRNYRGSREASAAADDDKDAEETASDHVSSEKGANNINDTFTAIFHCCDYPSAAVPYSFRIMSSSKQSFPAVQMGDLQMLLKQTTMGS
jgi:hypothetical protein